MDRRLKRQRCSPGAEGHYDGRKQVAPWMHEPLACPTYVLDKALPGRMVEARRVGHRPPSMSIRPRAKTLKTPRTESGGEETDYAQKVTVPSDGWRGERALLWPSCCR